MNPDAMFVITALVCGSAIALYVALENGRETAEQTVHQARLDGTREDEAPTLLLGTWDQDDLMAEAHWWRCTRCGECEVQLPGHLAAIHAADHRCTPQALERAKAEAKAQHPAYRPRRNDDETGLFGGEYR